MRVNCLDGPRPDGESLPACLIRRWNLGETVRAFADGKFRVKKLIEEPALEQTSLPGTFTLVAALEQR